MMATLLDRLWVSTVVAVGILLVLVGRSSSAFATPVRFRPLHQARTCCKSICCVLSATDNLSESNGEAAPYHPALTREEAEALLDSIPVYAVTETSKDGLILLKEENNSKEIAYFFFSPETANTVYAPLRQKTKEASATWDVTQYPLGLVWFELLAKNADGVEYRLVPETNQLTVAQNLLKEQAKQMGAQVPDMFQSKHNEIPVFMDKFLRIQTPDGEEKFPLYLGYQDLVVTLQQAAASKSGGYEATITVIDLKSLVDQMIDPKGTTNDFRKATFVPPSLSQPSGSGKVESFLDDDSPVTTPTATENWED